MNSAVVETPAAETSAAPGLSTEVSSRPPVVDPGDIPAESVQLEVEAVAPPGDDWFKRWQYPLVLLALVALALLSYYLNAQNSRYDISNVNPSYESTAWAAHQRWVRAVQGFIDNPGSTRKSASVPTPTANVAKAAPTFVPTVPVAVVVPPTALPTTSNSVIPTLLIQLKGVGSVTQTQPPLSTLTIEPTALITLPPDTLAPNAPEPTALPSIGIPATFIPTTLLPTATAPIASTPVAPTTTATGAPTATPVPSTSTVAPTATAAPTSTPATTTTIAPTSTPATTATIAPTSTPPNTTTVAPTNPPTTTTLAPTSPPTLAPTSTPVPPTATPAPTSTPIPPTSTPVPPTSTPVPPTSTPVPPTSTPVPPTPTPQPTVCVPLLPICVG